MAQNILDAGAHIVLYMRSRTRPPTPLHPNPWQIYPFGWKTQQQYEHRAKREKYRMFLESVRGVIPQSTTGLTSESNCNAACEERAKSFDGKTIHLNAEVVEMCKAAYGCAILANL